MIAVHVEELSAKKCAACEGGIHRYTPEEVRAQLALLPGWRLTEDGQRIQQHWQMKDFMAGIDFIRRVAQLAEQEGHHPDLHLEGYRHVWIELWTHAMGGLTENDFILAAKINGIGVRS